MRGPNDEPMLPPRGIFGVPHGILSSPDEWIAAAIGVVALVFAVLYDGDLDLRPLSGAAAAGIVFALLGSFLAPPVVAEEWHVPVVVVLLVLGGVALVRRRAKRSDESADRSAEEPAGRPDDGDRSR